MTQSILQSANGKGAGTSNLNQYLGTNLSYEQMTQLGGPYGVSARVGEGVISEKGLAYLREMIGDAKETADGLVNFKDTIAYKKFESGEMYQNIDMSAMIPKYITQPENTMKYENVYYGGNVTIEQTVNVQGSLDKNVLPDMKKVMMNVADESFKKN